MPTWQIIRECRIKLRQQQLASVEQGRKRVAHVPLQQCTAAPIARSTQTPTEQPNSVARGGARNRKRYDGEIQEVSIPQSAADVRRMLAEVMAETRAGKMDPKLGSALAYMAAALLRAYEADPRTPVNPPAMPNVYRALRFRVSTEITETIQQKELQAPSTEARPGLPAPTTEAVASQAKQEDEVVILDY